MSITPPRDGRYVADLTHLLASGDPEICVRVAVTRYDLSLPQREIIRDALAAHPLSAQASRMFAAAVERRIARTVHEATPSLEWGGICVHEGAPVVHGRVSGWQYYSSREGSHYRQAAYVGGWDDSGWWVVRVPSTVSDLRTALGSLEPAEVRHARAVGRRVVRQGDIYAIETTRSRDAISGAVCGTRHTWYQQTRMLSHPEHRAVRIPFPVHFSRRRVLAMRAL